MLPSPSTPWNPATMTTVPAPRSLRSGSTLMSRMRALVNALSVSARTDRESQRAERDGRVGPAEAEGVGQRGADRHAACRVGNEIEVAARILMEQVCGGRRDLVP